ncbi:UNVERIFIED_CONTAM: hypothetical protein RMT77_014845 [Armadillidium vulgare]
MDIKSENEIKLEELDLEYDSYQQDSQTFSDNESHFVLMEDIKNEELGEKTSIKSELRECKKEPMLGEELVNTDVIKSENLTVMEKKTCAQHLQDIMGNAAEGENDFEEKLPLRSRSPGAATDQQKSHLEYLSCKYCNFSFKSKDELKSHLKTHRKEKFICSHCNFESKFIKNFKKHLLTHSKRKFKCSHCSYECNMKVYLKRHMLTHANVKLYKCSDCSYECNYKASLKLHKLSHVNVKLLKCSDCSYECNRKAEEVEI